MSKTIIAWFFPDMEIIRMKVFGSLKTTTTVSRQSLKNCNEATVSQLPFLRGYDKSNYS
ncbi:MAG: hypothetical protein OXC39_08990 [Candidatus Dadabacteria bacterium]|nr:hypothetical protein [Candidatus Dadabacteria bacterium]